MLTTMLTCLLLLVALSARGGASPTLASDDGDAIACDRCPPGTYLSQRCDCSPCPRGSFTELWNTISSCLRCRVCGHNQRVEAACAADRDCRCSCNDGFYLRPDSDTCAAHSECPAGFGAVTPGSALNNTVCEVCSNGTFSDVSSARRNCTEHRCCPDAGRQLLLRGSTWHDSVCADCQQVKDGAVYLKEILPAFLVHQQMTTRRLRRIALRLPSEDGQRPTGVSQLDAPALHRRIMAWAHSATASQIRELPAILRNTGASGAADRLQAKLQRIDAALDADCGRGNEVEL